MFGSRLPFHSSVKRIIRVVDIGKRLPVFLILSLQFFPGVGQDNQLFAQVQPGFDPTGRFGQPPPLEKKTEPLPPKPAPDITLPPVETIPELKGAPPQIRVMVRKIQVEGSTVFSAEELAKVTAPYENRELSTNDLEELRRALTLLYVNKGYVNSGAVIPDQTLQNGVVTIQIIEGKLTDIQIEGTKYFLPFYFEDRIALSSGPPLNINPLKEKLQLLLQDPRTERLNTELKPGLKPGEGVLHVQVEEASPFKAWVEFNNYQSPTVGESRGLGNIAVQNPFGLGDAFRFTYGQSKGLQPLIEGNYVIPLTARDTTLELNFRFNDFNVVTKPFDVWTSEPNPKYTKSPSVSPSIAHSMTKLPFPSSENTWKIKVSLVERGFPFSPGQPTTARLSCQPSGSGRNGFTGNPIRSSRFDPDSVWD